MVTPYFLFALFQAIQESTVRKMLMSVHHVHVTIMGFAVTSSMNTDAAAPKVSLADSVTSTLMTVHLSHVSMEALVLTVLLDTVVTVHQDLLAQTVRPILMTVCRLRAVMGLASMEITHSHVCVIQATLVYCARLKLTNACLLHASMEVPARIL